MPGEGASLAFWLERLLSRSWCKLSQSFFFHLHVGAIWGQAVLHGGFGNCPLP